MSNKNRDRTLYYKLRETSDGYTGRELMESKKSGKLFLVISEERNRVPIENWTELEGDYEEIVKSWDYPSETNIIEMYIKNKGGK